MKYITHNSMRRLPQLSVSCGNRRALVVDFS
jgi:hypothetical protein